MAIPVSLLSPEEAAEYQSRARQYGPPEARRLNVSAIVAKYRMRFPTFYKRQKHGWPNLNGDTLTSVYEPCPGVPGGREATFLEEDIIRALPPVEDPERLLGDDGSFWLTAARVCRDLCIANRTLNQWDCACPYLDNEPLLPRQKKSLATSALVKTYLEDLVNQVKEKMREAKRGRWTDRQGRAWLSRARARRELRSGNQGCPRMTLHWWRKHATRHLGGRKLRAERKGFKRNPFATSQVGTRDI